MTKCRVDESSIEEAIEVRSSCEKAIGTYRLGVLVPFNKDLYWINNEEELLNAIETVEEINKIVGDKDWVNRLLHPENYDMWNSSEELFSFIKTMQKELRLWNNDEGQHIKNTFHAEKLEKVIEKSKIRRARLFKMESARRVQQRKLNKRFIEKDSEGRLVCRWCRGKKFIKINNQAQCKQCDAWIDFDKESKSWKCLHE